MKLIWCSGVPEIYGQLAEGVGSVCHGYLCILLYLNLFGVVVLHRSLVDERRAGVSLPWVYVHSPMYKTYSVEWCCIDLWSMTGGGWVQSAMGICAYFYMCN